MEARTLIDGSWEFATGNRGRVLVASGASLVLACGLLACGDPLDAEEGLEAEAESQELTYDTFSEPNFTRLSFENDSAWFRDWGTEAAWSNSNGWDPLRQVSTPVRYGSRAMRAMSV